MTQESRLVQMNGQVVKLENGRLYTVIVHEHEYFPPKVSFQGLNRPEHIMLSKYFGFVTVVDTFKVTNPVFGEKI